MSAGQPWMWTGMMARVRAVIRSSIKVDHAQIRGGLLNLKVFEARYLDLVADCLRSRQPFGVVCLRTGNDTARKGVALEDAATIAGLAFGLWVGLALETKAVRFTVAGPWWQRVLRYVIGIIGLVAVWMGLRMVFPHEPTTVGIALRMVRYALAMLWAIVGWPWLFVRIKLGMRAEG